MWCIIILLNFIMLISKVSLYEFGIEIMGPGGLSSPEMTPIINQVCQTNGSVCITEPSECIPNNLTCKSIVLITNYVNGMVMTKDKDYKTSFDDVKHAMGIFIFDKFTNDTGNQSVGLLLSKKQGIEKG